MALATPPIASWRCFWRIAIFFSGDPSASLCSSRSSCALIFSRWLRRHHCTGQSISAITTRPADRANNSPIIASQASASCGQTVAPRPSDINWSSQPSAQYQAIAPSRASFSRPLPASIQPVAPNIRLSPAIGSSRLPLGSMLAPTQRPSPVISVPAKVRTRTSPASARTGGSVASRADSMADPGLKSSIARRSQTKPARSVPSIAPSSHGPANFSQAAPSSTAIAVPSSRLRRTSPFFAASSLRFGVGSKLFSPASSLIAPAGSRPVQALGQRGRQTVRSAAARPGSARPGPPARPAAGPARTGSAPGRNG